MRIRPIEELVSVTEPAWPHVAALLAQDSSAEVQAVAPDKARDALHRLQVTAGSVLGALALNTGGIIADHGWFRLLGGGSEHLPDLASANGLGGPAEGATPPSFLVVGYDALGGRFAIDGGGLGVDLGEVCYFGPDSLTWGGLGGGHADFVTGVLSGSLTNAFASLRWPGWQEEVSVLLPDQGLALYPPPFTQQGANIGAVSRFAVPLSELLYFYDHAAAQM